MNFNKIALSFLMTISTVSLFSCSENNEVVDPSDSALVFEDNTRDYVVGYESSETTIKFVAPTSWKVEIEPGIDWLYVSPATGKAGNSSIKVSTGLNSSSESRKGKFTVTSGSQSEVFSFTQPEYGGDENNLKDPEKEEMNPEDVQDLDKYYKPAEFANINMFKKTAKWSWYRSKQSEHFFVFWEDGFGDDPNASSVPASMRVDIDDLLAKAEIFFDTNVNQLGMATLGEGKSMLDDYKMEIYLLYQDEWLATGSGYDDMIGALWVNPSTCQPVGSTIAHEIGHSFQYQTYADRIRKQGATNDFTTGFRYGFVGPDGAGNGGCGYWEQCAQWQAQRDYPREQFETYNFGVWLNNCHRHFHHEWQRYASYWLQSYWVEKHGIEAYGRIWREANQPEDAIMAYTRLYNGGNYATTREELMDYAMRMATYDIKDVREYANGYQNLYDPKFVVNDKNEFQITYGSCPGATGFNIIPLTVPSNGGTVKVNFRGLEYGASLATGDKSSIVDGDGVPQGKPTAYNSVGGASNMGWRYGFVALKGDQRTYGTVGKDATGSISFNVPAGADYLFLVVQGSPETYMSHGWDEKETNDPQFPYAITLEGTTLQKYSAPLQATYKEENGCLVGTLNVSIPSNNEDWVYDNYDIAEKAVADYLGVSTSEIGSLIVQPEVNKPQVAQEGKIVVFNEEADGSLSNNPTATVGYWLDKDGNAVAWGNGHIVYYEINSSLIALGKLGSEASSLGSVTMRPVFVYTKNGQEKTVKFVITYNFK